MSNLQSVSKQSSPQVMECHKAVALVKPHVVRIRTPRLSGTGFLLFNSATSGVCAIATAAHVVDAAYAWEEHIRIEFTGSTASTLLRSGDRAIIFHEPDDVAAIIFPRKDMKLPDTAISLIPEGKILKVGSELGWLGFPGIAKELCFFSGRVSAFSDAEHGYLVDGVAINGVSGGPAFFPLTLDVIDMIGVVSAYRPNRVTGETLPGLAVISDVSGLRTMVAGFKSMYDAQSKQTPPGQSDAPPPP